MPAKINYETDLTNLEARYRNGTYDVAFNGLSGIEAWECYMLIKYGHQYNFGLSGDKEYLVQLPVYPEQVTEQIAVKWATQDILGRSSPVSAYANTELKNVHFTMDFHRDLLTGCYSLSENAQREILRSRNKEGEMYRQAAGLQLEADNGPFGTRTWYVNVNKMLQMACYPQYTDNGLIPPTTYFIFGQMILKGYVLNYSTTWKTPIINSFYSNNSVDISMDCYPDTIITAHDLISKNTSTQNTYNTEFPTQAASNSDVDKRVYYNELNRHNYRGSGSLGGSPIKT